MAKAFTFFIDPGHGWLKVSRYDLAELGLSDQDFTAYSFIKGDYLYLEEDCDASKFVEVYQAKHGTRPAIKESLTNSNSRIRSYPRINKPF
jgi:hypothetical protein